MVQFLEFIGNHLVLAAMWVVTLAAIIFYHKKTSASGVGPQEAIMMINRKDYDLVEGFKYWSARHIVLDWGLDSYFNYSSFLQVTGRVYFRVFRRFMVDASILLYLFLLY